MHSVREKTANVRRELSLLLQQMVSMFHRLVVRLEVLVADRELVVQEAGDHLIAVEDTAVDVMKEVVVTKALPKPTVAGAIRAFQ
jgi:hypothetical protein